MREKNERGKGSRVEENEGRTRGEVHKERRKEKTTENIKRSEEEIWGRWTSRRKKKRGGREEEMCRKTDKRGEGENS